MSRRPRGRGRKPQHNNNNRNNNPNRALDSNGPDVRVRGSAKTIYDKYISLAHDASVSGRRIKAESYLQHAEHYWRIVQELAVIAEQKAEQQRIANEKREQEQAARKAEHAARVEKRKAEQAAKTETDEEGSENSAEATKADTANSETEAAEDKPKKRVRSHLSRRRPVKTEANGNDEVQADKAEAKDEAPKKKKPKKRKKVVTESEVDAAE